MTVSRQNIWNCASMVVLICNDFERTKKSPYIFIISVLVSYIWVHDSSFIDKKFILIKNACNELGRTLYYFKSLLKVLINKHAYNDILIYNIIYKKNIMVFCHLCKIQYGITSFQPTLDPMPMLQYLRNYRYVLWLWTMASQSFRYYKMMPTSILYQRFKNCPVNYLANF